MRRTLVVIAYLMAFQDSHAQQLISLEEAIAAALQHNYDILLVKNDSAIAAVDVKLAYGAFLPAVNATAGKIWNSNNQQLEFADGSKVKRTGVKTNTLNPAVVLNWTLFDGLKMFATRDRLNELLILGELNIRNQIVTTVADVINNYYNIVRQKQQLRAVREQMSINEERVKLADKKLSVGLGSKPELLQARVDLNAQKAVQLQELTLIDQLKNQMNQLTGMQLPGNFDVSDSIPINSDLQFGDIQNNIANTNPTLLVARKNIDIANLLLRERKAERWPVIGFNSGYNLTRQVNNIAVNPSNPLLLSRNSGFNYGFSASIPIFNNFITRRNIKVAELDIRTQQLSFNNQLTLIDVGLNNAFKNYEYQKQALQLEEENIQLAKENVSIALERFRQGVSTYLELRDAQISLEQAYNRLIAARYNTKLAETELLRLKGDILK